MGGTTITLAKQTNTNNMKKYYRVIKDTFLWEEGAILQHNGNNGYEPVQDVWDKIESQTEYISTRLVENNPEWFERVYCDNLDKMLFVTKENLKKAYSKMIK